MTTSHYEFVGEVPLDVLCGICLMVPNDPHRVTCCGRHFCQPCITEWLLTQHYQCPLCFRPHTSHHSDSSLSHTILLLPVYCTSRQKGCTWQGLLRDVEVHLTSDDGCQFSLVECPLAEFGCQPHALQRRDLSKHMADKHTSHMKILIGNLKRTSSRLETREREMEELQQKFLLFSSQLNSTLQAQSGLGRKTDQMQQELQKMKSRVSELEDTLHRVRPHSLSHLDRALSDTFPPLRSFLGEGGSSDDGEGEEEEVSLNGSLLRGLREIEEREGRVGVVSENPAGGEGEEAGLPIGGDLPTESAAVPGEEEEGGSGAGRELMDDLLKSSEERGGQDLTSDPAKPDLYPTILPTYATAVSKPFHPVLRGLGPMSNRPDSAPVMQQSSMSRLPQTNTVTVTNSITTATVATDNKGTDHYGNKEEVVFPSNHSSAFTFLNTMVTADSVAAEANLATGRQSRLSQDAEPAVPSGDLLEEGFGVLPRCGSAGWVAEWHLGEGGVCTPRSDSSLSLHSSSSSDTSFVGDTVIQYGSSTVIVSTTSGKKSPSPDHTQVKLFVKYMPHCCSPEKAVSLFLAYGKVHLLEYHSEHRDKLFLIMDREGGLQAMAALNGTRLAGSPKPLSVQLYRSPLVSMTPIVQRAESITSDKTLRLFVKNLGSDMTPREITDLFSVYGKVFDVQKHPNRRNVAFIYMCQEGGNKAIANLNGFHSQQINRPLIVELSHEPTTGVPVKV